MKKYTEIENTIKSHPPDTKISISFGILRATQKNYKSNKCYLLLIHMANSHI